MLSRIVASLQFRLVVSFAFVLALTLAGVSLYIGRVADREADRLVQDVDTARHHRIKEIVTKVYLSRFDSRAMQIALENAGSFYGWRLILNDPQGRKLADSHFTRALPELDPSPNMRRINIVSLGQPAATLWIELDRSDHERIAPEPGPSRIVDDLNRSLVWAGLAGGLIGLIVVSALSQSVLAPVRALGRAASRLGAGDLKHRVERPGLDEIGDLSRTFNAMAEGLETAETRRRALVADVAHELRTPLSNIQGYLEAVKDDVLEADEETIDTIYGQARQLSRLVEDLRVLAMAESGALRLDLAEMSVGELVRQSADAFLPRAAIRGVSFEVQVDEGAASVMADRARIEQVVGNLIDNAITHSPEGGTVSLTCGRSDDGGVRVTVADNGPGIPSSEAEMVFERFYRVDPSRSRTTGGAGLGLTIARQMIEAHGGRIWLESAEGEGTRFIFELPGPESHSSER